MKNIAYCLFETQLGWCGIAWHEPEGTVVLLELPEASPALTEEKIVQNCGAQKAGELPRIIADLINKIGRHLRGDIQDFRDIAVDVENRGLFAQQVYTAARAIPAGQAMTYGELAKAINRPKACRAVGQALGRNPVPLIIPCHRVLAAGHKLGGFSAYGGLATKARLLALEGVTLEKTPLPEKILRKK